MKNDWPVKSPILLMPRGSVPARRTKRKPDDPGSCEEMAIK